MGIANQAVITLGAGLENDDVRISGNEHDHWLSPFTSRSVFGHQLGNVAGQIAAPIVIGNHRPGIGVA